MVLDENGLAKLTDSLKKYIDDKTSGGGAGTVYRHTIYAAGDGGTLTGVCNLKIVIYSTVSVPFTSSTLPAALADTYGIPCLIFDGNYTAQIGDTICYNTSNNYYDYTLLGTGGAIGRFYAVFDNVTPA